MIDSRKPDLTIPVVGVLALLLGLAVLLGWASELAVIAQVIPNGKPMVPLTAFCFALSGLALLASERPASGYPRTGQAICLGLLLLLAGAKITEIAIGREFGVESLAFGWLMPTASGGRMSPWTALAFLLFGIGMLAPRFLPGRVAALLARLAAGALFAIGVLAALGYALKFPYLFETLYLKTGLLWMAFPTACGLVLLGAGLWHLSSRYLPATEADGVDADIRGIYRTMRFVLIMVSGATGLVGLVFLETSIEKQTAADLLKTLQVRREFVELNLDYRIQRARIASKNPIWVETLSTLQGTADDKPALERARREAAALLDNGFSAVALESGGTRRTLAGSLLPGALFGVRPRDAADATLTWRNGYYLRLRMPLGRVDGGSPSGYLIAEQRLPHLDNLFMDASTWGETGVLAMCVRTDASTLTCLPRREMKASFDIPDRFDGELIPVARALRNETGVGVTNDYRGRRVMAAYGPVGATGLGMVFKKDLSEVFAAEKEQFLFAIPFIALLVALGLGLTRSRIKPMARRILRAHVAEKAERDRFEAAAESSPDAFVIFENVRNAAGDITDLRYVYLNRHAKAIPEMAGDLEGNCLRELFPAYAAVFEKYKAVALSGEMLIEEFTHQHSTGETRHYVRQIVPMPDGVAVTFRDVTARRNMLRQIEESNRLRSAILESASYAIVSTDVNGTILTFNKAAERMLWYSADELIGKAHPGIFHDVDEINARAEALSEELGQPIEPGFDVFVAKARQQGQEEREWTYVRKDGSRFPVKLSVSALRDENQELQGFLGIAYDISEQKRAEEYIRHLALHDVLTGLPNRALLEDRVNREIEHQQRNGTPFALIMMDIDRFKNINDSMGHHIGDKLLVEFVARVNGCVRPTDTLARMGGDEFVLLLAETESAGAKLVAERILAALKAPIGLGLQELHVTTSMGVSICPRDGAELNELVRCADVAMYWVKENGRNGCKEYAPDMDHGSTERLHLERDLHRALDAGEFSLFYQPQVNLASGAVIGMEALLRWRKPDGRYVSPATFIPLAEETGLIVPIGNWVLRTACRDAFSLEAATGRRLRMAVNISPRQFVNGDLTTIVRETLDASRLGADRLELEITEGVLMDERSGVAATLLDLHALGVGIAIDDFGTGYSSLGYLKRFPISKLKIDQSFVRDVTSDAGDAALAEAIIAMGHSLKIPVVAEGIETAEQLSFLAERKCDHGQGFHIGRPMPFYELMQWLVRHGCKGGVPTRQHFEI